MILLFGARGQLGQELVALAQQREVALRGMTRVEADIADAQAIAAAIAATQPSLVVNAAAYTAVDKAETEIEAAARANVSGPAVVATACAAARLPMIHISTDYVFDGQKIGAYREQDPIAPLSVYGRTKAAGEEAIRSRLANHLILRTSWVYGAYGRNVLKTVLKLAAERDELAFVADQRGCPTSTADLAEAILHLASLMETGEHAWGTYHLAGTGATTWFEFVRQIVGVQAEFTDRRPQVRAITTAEYPTPARRPANSELDSRLFEETFDFRAQPWERRVESTVNTLLHGSAGLAA